MKKRVIVLDTNVLLHDPESPLHFANENVVIAILIPAEVWPLTLNQLFLIDSETTIRSN